MKTKINFLLFAGIILASLAMNSCKKGENDPFISLKSRDARITAKWKLTKIEGTNVNGTPSVTQTIRFNGTTYSETYSTGNSNSATGSFEMTIDKKGTLNYSETFTPSSGTSDVESGTSEWYWIDSDKSKLFWFSNIYTNLFDGGARWID